MINFLDITLRNKDMKSKSLFIFLLMHSFLVNAQNEIRHALDFGDVYVIKVKIDKEHLRGKCPCNKNDKCVLFQVQMLDVIYCPTNRSFDNKGLLGINYILVSSKELSGLYFDSSIIITAKPSGSNYYLSFSKVLNIKEAENYQFYHPYAYLSEIDPCKSKDKFEKYILKCN